MRAIDKLITPQAIWRRAGPVARLLNQRAELAGFGNVHFGIFQLTVSLLSGQCFDDRRYTRRNDAIAE
jgi:hypothetical protein